MIYFFFLFSNSISIGIVDQKVFLPIPDSIWNGCEKLRTIDCNVFGGRCCDEQFGMNGATEARVIQKYHVPMHIRQRSYDSITVIQSSFFFCWNLMRDAVEFFLNLFRFRFWSNSCVRQSMIVSWIPHRLCFLCDNWLRQRKSDREKKYLLLVDASSFLLKIVPFWENRVNAIILCVCVCCWMSWTRTQFVRRNVLNGSMFDFTDSRCHRKNEHLKLKTHNHTLTHTQTHAYSHTHASVSVGASAHWMSNENNCTSPSPSR